LVLPTKGAETQVYVQALPLDPRVNYRLDARLDPTRPALRVDTDAALWRLGLAPRALGWSAWTQTPGQQRVFHPVAFGGGGDTDSLEIVLRSPMEAALVTARV